jgi:molecular chaperone DnaJ
LLVKVRADAIFGRDGDDLTLTVPIGYHEAVLGTDLRVPTLDGAVTLRVAPGTPSGRILRVRGRGVPRRDGGLGDLLITIDVDVPANLSPEARKALEEYAMHAPAPARAAIDDMVRRHEFRGNHARPEYGGDHT